MPESTKLSPELVRLLGEDGFRARRKLAIPLLTCDPEGTPRAALLAFSEIRALSPRRMAAAVASGSRTEANLIRRPGATILVLDAGLSVSIRCEAGKAHVSIAQPDRKIFPLRVVGVKEDEPLPGEQNVAIAAGPRFAGPRANEVFLPALFEELAGPSGRGAGRGK
ncbi:MAG TPA: hypothetical protein VFS34_07315 [Thermoanaerobaculia bacterium]|nr:hypothetical protein [Thermoanaerobaculia bacterium]